MGWATSPAAPTPAAPSPPVEMVRPATTCFPEWRGQPTRPRDGWLGAVRRLHLIAVHKLPAPRRLSDEARGEASPGWGIRRTVAVTAFIMHETSGKHERRASRLSSDDTYFIVESRRSTSRIPNPALIGAAAGSLFAYRLSYNEQLLGPARLFHRL